MADQNRSRILGLAAGLGLIVASAGGSHAGEMVEFKNAMGQPTRAYLAAPEGDAKAPAVLVIQEWWGLTDWIKENADRLAEDGYVALAVDLYDGKSTDDPGEAHELMRALDPSEGVADLEGAIEFLRSHDRVDQGKKIGSVGWCMGGMYSRLIAQQSDQVGPTVICYGSVTTDPEQVGALAGRPVLGIFGAQDRGIPADRVREVFEALREGGSEVDLHLYDDAGHAFMRPGGDQYVESDADDAWQRIEAFFAEHLKGSD
ncbi:dienelactone hydrolase family protein [Tautonia plasticadhaerens]|uniref:Carboxymethylenebutenolidase n=1 Tax=Tautonia plasticadhaerens TaxID=2527974 RepID=A0A518H078_9BACT|nr:dienelactone hydrolase family protein [Tautonia plasticadhaerens]QDV34239.1 Carboxymethylenebutenolidase [Tautonia plasticadhaerens]